VRIPLKTELTYSAYTTPLNITWYYKADLEAGRLTRAQVKEWLDKELNYIRHKADTFRGKFNLPS
jgi:hypothetical protein